ncbi:MAG: ribonuclease H family protein [Oscillospiraceae bacterium]|jgi:ribonuclease HI|nr:ribonuclease H family protein [Oscillospiraceae bacterium]
MAKKQKFYAVKRGYKTGIFNDWNVCLEHTKGFSGAEFKSFNTQAEAEAYLADEDIVLSDDIKPRLKKGRVVAFVDGSYNYETSESGLGVLFLLPDGSEIELSEKSRKFKEFRNIAGEILAVTRAVEWCVAKGYKKVSIFFDFTGIRSWALGKWDAKTVLTQFYKNFIDEHRNVIDMEFVKVAGHSNNIYNNRVDKLAKNAVKG